MTQIATWRTLTGEVIEAAAAEFCERNGWDSGRAADIALVCDSPEMSGYEIAVALERECDWHPTLHDVEVLRGFVGELRALESAGGE